MAGEWPDVIGYSVLFSGALCAPSFIGGGERGEGLSFASPGRWLTDEVMPMQLLSFVAAWQ